MAAYAPSPSLPTNLPSCNQILFLGLIEGLRDPENFRDELRRKMAQRGSELIIPASNLGSLGTPIMLRVGQFNYKYKGILRTAN